MNRFVEGIWMLCLMAGVTLLPPLESAAEETAPVVTYRSLSPEIALRLVRNTLEACRQDGYQVGVAVVDRSGILQAYVRDRYAGPHTVDVAIRKAWTAASFRTDTLSMVEETQAGKLQSGIRMLEKAMMVGGGIPIEVDGSVVGALGVSVAADGVQDDRCGRKGLASIEDDLNLF